MTMIPNGRTDKNYNQKYLNEKDHDFLDGFDWCCEMAVDNFFDNHFDGAVNNFVECIMMKELPEYLQDEYEMEYSFFDVKNEKREVRTCADLVRMWILEWVEMARNELITSMIESMDNEEYQKIKEQVDGGQSEAEN